MGLGSTSALFIASRHCSLSVCQTITQLALSFRLKIQPVCGSYHHSHITATSSCRQVPTLLKLLARAVANGMPEMVAYLKAAIPDAAKPMLSSFRQSGSGMGLLHLAVRSGKTAVVAVLLEGSETIDWQVRLACLHYFAVLCSDMLASSAWNCRRNIVDAAAALPLHHCSCQFKRELYWKLKQAAC